MSAIFGILNLDGLPVDPEKLTRMKQAMAYWGPDGARTWAERPVGLGHLMLYSTPESAYENLPLTSEAGHLVLTAAARLDNRADLFRRLDIPDPERPHMSDSALILKAYEKWDTACVDYLLGDWTFALWDVSRRRLFIARDHCGYSSLYYYHDSHIFVFASSLKGILALPDVPRRLNEEAILQRFPGFPRDAQTTYEGILRLLPGHTITVANGRVDLHCYWHPQDVPEVRFRSGQKYLDAFLEIYTEAVRCRLRSYHKVGVALSGGLDSGSVATLAAHELAQRGERLLAFSAVPRYDVTGCIDPQRCGDETPFVEALCRHVGSIDVTYVDAANISPLAGIERVLDILEQPEMAAANFHWMVALLESAQRQRVGTLLTGQGGNFTVSDSGDRDAYLLGLFRHGDWRTWIHEIRAWRRVDNISVWHVIKSHVIKPLLPATWLRRYRRFKVRRWTPANPAFARSLVRTRQVTTTDQHQALRRLPSRHRHLSSLLQSGVAEIWVELGAAFGLEVRDPTLDKRVVEFCLGIPESQYTRNGQERLLIRRAMAGLMPDSVLWNDHRGRQAADIGHRVRNSGHEIEAALQKLEKSPLAQQYLDLPRMQRVFDTLQHRLDPTVSDEVSAILLRGLVIGLFLQRFEHQE